MQIEKGGIASLNLNPTLFDVLIVRSSTDYRSGLAFILPAERLPLPADTLLPYKPSRRCERNELV